MRPKQYSQSWTDCECSPNLPHTPRTRQLVFNFGMRNETERKGSE